jgi:hypothetical protein
MCDKFGLRFFPVLFQGGDEYGVEIGRTSCGDSPRHCDAAANGQERSSNQIETWGYSTASWPPTLQRNLQKWIMMIDAERRRFSSSAGPLYGESIRNEKF